MPFTPLCRMLLVRCHRLSMAGAAGLKFSALALAGIMATILGSCVVMHHAQVGDIDNRRGMGKRFEVMVSEMGFNLDEATSIAKSLTRSKAARSDLGRANAIVSMFQSGPRTGNLVLDDSYARDLVELIKARCPSGRVTGLTSVRESNKYPVISGEIVKITGYCLKA